MRKITFILVLWSVLPLMARKPAPVQIEQARIKLVPAASPATAAFMTLRNTSTGELKLVQARFALARTVEMHSMTMVSGKMAMRPVKDIPLPVGQKVELKPGGLHLMLIGLKKPLLAGETHEIKLEFSDGSTTTIKATVEA